MRRAGRLMRVVRGLRTTGRIPQRTVVTIGMFDGVHLAHQRLVREAIRLAKRLRGTSVAVTFDPDPQQVLSPGRPKPAMMSLPARLAQLGALGLDLAVIIPFTRQFSRLSAEAFIHTVLIRRLHACCVVVGETFAFGSDRHGNLRLLRRLGRQHGVRIVALRTVRRGGLPVSSSRIRQLIQQGNLHGAKQLLGRPVELSGIVIRGRGVGRRLGFPTANLRLTHQLLPPPGVYKVRLTSGSHRWDGLMNVGYRPTFSAFHSRGQKRRSMASPRTLMAADGQRVPTCEVHLVGFRGTLYGRSVTVVLLEYLRPERRFAHARDLIRQIQRDLIRANLTASCA